MSDASRIKHITDELESKNISFAQFCRDIGVSGQTGNHWKTRGIPHYMVPKVAEYLHWTEPQVRGEDGEPKLNFSKKDQNSVNFTTNQLVSEKQSFYSSDFVEIPFMDNDKAIKLPRSLIDLKETKNLRAVFDSSGEIGRVLGQYAAIIDLSQTHIEHSKIYAIDYGGEPQLRRILKRFDGSLMLKSEGAEDEFVDKENINKLKILGRLIYVLGGPM